MTSIAKLAVAVGKKIYRDGEGPRASFFKDAHSEDKAAFHYLFPGKSKKVIGYSAHIDVHSDFGNDCSVVLKGDKLIGVLDNSLGVALLLKFLEELKKGYKPLNTVRLIFTKEEEKGLHDWFESAEFLKDHLKVDLMVSIDGHERINNVKEQVYISDCQPKWVLNLAKKASKGLALVKNKFSDWFESYVYKKTMPTLSLSPVIDTKHEKKGMWWHKHESECFATIKALEDSYKMIKRIANEKI